MKFNSERIFYLSNETFDTGSDRFTRGYNFGKQFSCLADRPEALVIYSDSVALGFLKACSENKIKIPNDVGIIGFDDIAVAKHASIPLTTIRQNHDKIGAGAVEILQKRIDGIDIGNRTIFKPILVVRESCGAQLNKNLNVTTNKALHASN
jgi:LacI family transcriptional regulator